MSLSTITTPMAAPPRTCDVRSIGRCCPVLPGSSTGAPIPGSCLAPGDRSSTRPDIQLSYMKNLFAKRKWYDLVPDQAHTVVTDGYGTPAPFGTGSVTTDTYATAARTSDGTLIIVYMPTIRTITADLSKLAGVTAAHWYDPTTGDYINVNGSPFVNSGNRQFTPPGKNGDGAADWLLVLEAN
jgi:hypothetical protein